MPETALKTFHPLIQQLALVLPQTNSKALRGRFTWRTGLRKTCVIVRVAQTQKLSKRHGPCDQLQVLGRACRP
jgi:hypothetical protein